MSDRLLIEIAAAAQRWRISQKTRLAAGRHLRQLSKEGKCLGGLSSPWWPVVRDAEAAVTRAKQVERKALRGARERTLERLRARVTKDAPPAGQDLFARLQAANNLVGCKCGCCLTDQGFNK